MDNETIWAFKLRKTLCVSSCLVKDKSAATDLDAFGVGVEAFGNRPPSVPTEEIASKEEMKREIGS
jgi:hypothetical protein